MVIEITMKKLACSVLFLLVIQIGLAQEKNQPYDLNIELGVNYQPFQYLGGFSFNGVVQASERRLGFALRNIFLFGFGPGLNSNGTISNYYYVLNDLYVMNYIDIDYNWRPNKKHYLITSLGAGHISIGNQNNENGYFVLSATVRYKVTWFYAVVRGDLPLSYYELHGIVDTAFPLTIGLTYMFKPKRNSE